MFITEKELKKYWSTHAICIEFSDGTDALAQENGYARASCLHMTDVKFFLD